MLSKLSLPCNLVSLNRLFNPTNPLTQSHTHGIQELLLTVEELFLGQILRIAQSFAPGDDGHLEQRICILQEPTAHCMSRLVIRNRLLLVRLQKGVIF